MCSSVKHGKCSTPFYLKRILDISDNGVVLREDVQPERYACLSHCWGPIANILKTETETLADFKVQVPWNKLSKTFQEAIDICRRLGIFYLWIDSLCIIQNSTTDWTEQAAKMGDIYEKAFIVIAATKSQDGSLGCYSKIDSVYSATTVPGYEDVYIRQLPPKFPTRWPERAETKLSCPLLHRAWCYQEMRLSSRVLHFCAQEVVWDCLSKRRSESGHNDEDLDLDKSRCETTIYEAVPYWKLTEYPTQLWYRTVQEYSGLDLTFSNDKMAALAALTQRMERLRVDDQFLAGLWKKTLLSDLLWTVWPSAKHPRPDAVTAPKWSWASVRGQVIWSDTTGPMLTSVRVVDIRYACVGSSHMGDVSEAKITVRAPLIWAGKIMSEHHHARRMFHDLGLADGVELTTSGGVDGSSNPVEDIAVYDFDPDYRVGDGVSPGSISHKDVFIIPVTGAYRGNNEGLCLRKVGSQEYERFGHVKLRHRIAMGNSQKDGKHWDRREEAGVLSTKILEALPVVEFTLI